MRLLNSFLIVMFLSLQYRLWVGDGSIGHVLALHEKIEVQQALNEDLKNRNALLVAEVIGLQQSHDSIEEYARTQLGMIKPDETFYLVIN